MEIKGKVINFLGDSITEGVGVSDVANCRYDNVIRREYGLKANNNYGIGGTRIAHQTKPTMEKPWFDLNFCGRVYRTDKNADIFVVYGGVNDYLHGDAPIGESTDTYHTTFWGGVNRLMDAIKEHFGDKPIVFMTPARCCFRGNTDEKVAVYENKIADAMPLENYVEIIKAAGKSHGIPVLDLYHTLPINPNDPEARDKYTVDGLHFNDAGHAIIAKTLAEFLLSL